MKKIKALEKKLYRFIGAADKNATPVVKDLLDFWKRYDALFGTNHYKILVALASPSAKRLTNEGLSLNLNVCDRTLLRYRKLYLQSYFAFCALEGVPPTLPDTEDQTG